MRIKPVDNVYFGAYLSHKQKDRNMEATEAFEIILKLAKLGAEVASTKGLEGKRLRDAERDDHDEALEVAEGYMAYWRGKTEQQSFWKGGYLNK